MGPSDGSQAAAIAFDVYCGTQVVRLCMPLDVAKLGLDFTKGVVVLWPCSSTYCACDLHHHTPISVQQTSSAAWTILCRMYWEYTHLHGQGRASVNLTSFIIRPAQEATICRCI